MPGIPGGVVGSHDTLILDGGNGNVNFRKCYVKVVKVKGNVLGAVWTKRTEELCGEIDTIYEAKWQRVREGDELEYNQLLETKADGMVKIELYDGTVLMLGNKTKVVMNYDFCTNFTIKVFLGRIWGKVKTVIFPAMHEVICNDRYACNQGGVRGTEYTYEVTEDPPDSVCIFKVYEGKVEMTPRQNANLDESDTAGNELKKLTGDLMAGKITSEEFEAGMEKYMQHLNELKDAMKSLMVEPGYRGISSRTKMWIEPIEQNDDRWWENW